MPLPLDLDRLRERVTRRLVLTASIASLAVLCALAWLVALATGRSFASLWTARASGTAGLLMGFGIGVALAAVGAALVSRAEALRALREVFRVGLSAARLTTLDAAVVGLCAGVGEELLFRAGMQPAIGLGWASAVFALLHTGIPRSAGVAAFALYVFAMGLLLGETYRRLGLGAAMALHAAFDWLLLALLARRLREDASSASAPPP